MDFSLPPEIEALRVQVAQFVRERIIPLEADPANYDEHENIAPAVLARMQARGVHLAQIRDRDGRILGIVFLEDVIEELVGEVHDATRRQRFAD